MSSDSVGIPHTHLSVYEAIYRRRMAWRFQDTPVDREAINRLLEVEALSAGVPDEEPNPHRTPVNQFATWL